MTGSQEPRSRRLAVIGLGYVGLPVAAAFARSNFQVIGYDIDRERIQELRKGIDRTREVDPADLRLPTLLLTSDAAALGSADFYIVTVPTPIDASRRPDPAALLGASEMIGGHLKAGDIVVYESTVYPGATEEDCAPVLERSSGLTAGKDFFLGYSPERINPGDTLHRFEAIRKVVSGQDRRPRRSSPRLWFGRRRRPSRGPLDLCRRGRESHRELPARSQHRLHERIVLIFQLLGIDTADVLAAAGTKWNFLPFTPGLVGGHCIGVDPYYLTYRAEREGSILR